MKLTISKSKNSCTLYVQKSFRDKSGKSTTKTVERLGSPEEICAKYGCEDAYAWAREYVGELTRQERLERRKVSVQFSPSQPLARDMRHLYNGGYLFLQQWYNRLGLPKICSEISARHKFKYDLNEILSRLVYTRVLYPGSKLSTFEESRRFIEQPKFSLEQIYRALSVIAKESDFVQSEVFKNSCKAVDRKTGVIYYDCTNYFFETERADDLGGLRQYGYSKEHRPNPIVQLGMFMDATGLPLAFCVNPGNTSEQVTMRPLEETLEQKFDLSEFVVCTDGGLASTENREYNSRGGRAFITVQSLKDNKIVAHLREWALEKDGWSISGEEGMFSIDSERSMIRRPDGRRYKTLYKERWINEKGFEQRLIVTFSYDYRAYQQALREQQILRAKKLILSGRAKNEKRKQNDARRFIKHEHWSDDGVLSAHETVDINQEAIGQEARFDGFYAICTNLEDDVQDILRVNSWRWEIEDMFRITKTEFDARPIFLRRDDRIVAHFITCFLALLLFKIIKQSMGTTETKKGNCVSVVTTEQLRQTLVDFNFLYLRGEGYIPAYTPDQFTDRLHQLAGFETDRQFVPTATMRQIIKKTKC